MVMLKGTAVRWRCFHCGEGFTEYQVEHARDHFGSDETATPVCQMRLPGEYHLLKVLRGYEKELARYRSEDTELHRAIHAMAADHSAALRREEEKGYNKGVQDARKDLPIRGYLVRNIYSNAGHFSHNPLSKVDKDRGWSEIALYDIHGELNTPDIEDAGLI